MPYPGIDEGFEVFPAEGGRAFGAVRKVTPRGRAELVVYVENAGDFTVPFSAIERVEIQKVIVDTKRLDPRLQAAIGHAHDAEDSSA